MVEGEDVNMFYNEQTYSTVGSWIVVAVQLFIAIVLLVVLPSINQLLEKRRKNERRKKEAEEALEKEGEESVFIKPTLSAASGSGWKSTMISTFHISDSSKPLINECCSPIFKTKRSQSNFSKSNFDTTTEFPSDYSPEYIPLDQRIAGLTYTKVLFQILSRPKGHEMLRLTFGFAFLASGLSSMLSILVSYTHYMQVKCMNVESVNGMDVEEKSITFIIDDWKCPGEGGAVDDSFFLQTLMMSYIHAELWLKDTANVLHLTIILFSFLPIFLMLAALSFLVDRWRSFLMTCHNMQGRIHDIGLICGSLPNLKYKKKEEKKVDSSSIDHDSNSNNGPANSLTSEWYRDYENKMEEKTVIKRAQEKLYIIYRYLTVAHILTMKSFSLNLKAIDQDYSILGSSHLNLLTPHEINLIAFAENKGRDAMMGMLNSAIDDLLEEDFVKCRGDAYIIPKATVLGVKMTDFRGFCAELHDMFVMENPNEYTAAISSFIYLYKILIVLMSPFVLMAGNSIPVFCLQPGVFLGVFFTFLSLSFPSLLFRALKNPFDPNGGIVTDNLIASSELCIFQTLRIRWWGTEDLYVRNYIRGSSKFKSDDDYVRDYIRRSSDIKSEDDYVRGYIRRSSAILPIKSSTSQDGKDEEEFQLAINSLKTRMGRFNGSLQRGEFGDL